MRKLIYCCACEKDVPALLIAGATVYPHRKDLHDLPFWRCEACKNFVGCHHKTKDRIAPLGVIATQDIKNARKHIHAILDPLWKNGGMKRGKIYARLAREMGLDEYHTAEIRSVGDARKVYRLVAEIAAEQKETQAT